MKTSGYFLALICALFLVACQATLESDSDNIAGIYTLVKVDGNAIPGSVPHDDTPLEISSGVFTINADGTCISKTVFIPPGGEPVTREVRARYNVNDSRLIMTWEGAGVTEGEVTGDTFVMDNHGMIFEYARTAGSGD